MQNGIKLILHPKNHVCSTACLYFETTRNSQEKHFYVLAQQVQQPSNNGQNLNKNTNKFARFNDTFPNDLPLSGISNISNKSV